MRYIVCYILFCCCQIVCAQGIKVKEVKETVSGSDAFHAPIDENGHPCGLVKVLTTIDDLTFEGNIIREVENKTNEYHVFLSKGSEKLIIKRPRILPLIIKFKDYGIEQIASKATYNIILKEEKMNTSKNGVIVNVRPAQAKVYVDDILIENENEDGSYQFVLPKGDYVFRFEEMGYRPSLQVVKTGKSPQTLNVELESLLADLEISCMTGTAEIWIGDELKGKGAWQGKLPAGTYMITAKQKGFSSETKEITIEEKSSRSLVLPMLERAEGKVVVVTDPQGSRVFIDGKGNFLSGQPIKVLTGQHTVIAKLPFGYKDGMKEIEVGEEGIDTISIVLDPINSTYASAFNGDVEKQLQLAKECYEKAMYNKTDTIEGNYWYEKAYKNMNSMDEKVFLSYYDYMNSHFRTRDNKKWLAILLKCNNIAPSHVDYSDIADCYESLLDFQSAIIWRKKNVDKAEQGSVYFLSRKLAETYEKAGDKTNAVVWYKKALEDLGDAAWLWNWLYTTQEIADACLRLGAKADAAKIYKQLISKNPNHENVGVLKAKLKQAGY